MSIIIRSLAYFALSVFALRCGFLLAVSKRYSSRAHGCDVRPFTLFAPSCRRNEAQAPPTQPARRMCPIYFDGPDVWLYSGSMEVAGTMSGSCARGREFLNGSLISSFPSRRASLAPDVRNRGARRAHFGLMDSLVGRLGLAAPRRGADDIFARNEY